MSRPKPPTYRTTNWSDYNAALARRGSLSIWFDPETQWLAAPTGKRGRQPLGIVAADGAYDTRTCHAAIAARGAAAVIPPRKNGKPWKQPTAGAAVRNAALRSCRRLGRAIWKRWAGYHRRSLAEAKMRCFKLLGERVMSRNFERQVAELQIRAAILNRFTALGTPTTQRAG